MTFKKNFRNTLKTAKRKEIAKKLVNQEKISLTIALKAMFLNKAVYYYTPKSSSDYRRKALDEELTGHLRNLRGYELTYGYKKATNLLNNYNHKKVYRHMKELNMLQPKKLKKKKHTRLPVSCPLGSNIRREGDLTYVWDSSKLNYLFCYSRQLR